MNLYLYSGLSYYNRKIIKYNTIAEYQNAQLGESDFNGNVSFNPNNSVSTNQIFNYYNHEFQEGRAAPSYLVVVDDSNEIVSRWWVLSAVRTRQGQAQLFLLRDVIADYLEEVLDAPVFIEKATLPTASNLIYNNENMTYNQIKVEEKLLKDKTATPWIVGYVASNYAGGSIDVPAGYTSVSYTLDSLEDYTYHRYTTSPFKGYYGTEATFLSFYNPGGSSFSLAYCWTPDKQKALTEAGTLGYQIYQSKTGPSTSMSLAELTDYVPDFFNQLQQSSADFSGDYTSYITDGNGDGATRTFLEENGKIIKVEDTYYRIDIEYLGKTLEYGAVAANSVLGQEFGKTLSFIDDVTSGGYYRIAANIPKYSVSYVEISLDSYSIAIPQDRIHLTDAPYDMFCMPFNAIEMEIGNTTSRITLVNEYFRFAMALAQELGSNLYDLQLVPYCPLPQKMLYGSAGDVIVRPKLYYDSDTIPKAVQYFTDSDENSVGALYWCETSTFSTNLTYTAVSLPTDPIEFKVANECEFYRVCSPNYNGVFEISAAKNRGLSGFTADCSYKPFTPYIRVAPEFGGLYGQNYGDARGLICGGDFSLPLINDAWEQYQIQNKNYQDIFNRQIENMEINNQAQRVSEIANLATGALGAGIQGGMAANMMGAGPASVGVGIATGVLSAGAGAADIYFNEKLRQEAIDFTKDNFGYQLGNIRALPNSLTKVSAYNANNKFFPFVEKYSASEEEKRALKEKIKYNGMTVMTIGTMREYLQPDFTYIKGKLIRLEGIDENYQVINTIGNELYKGVYI